MKFQQMWKAGVVLSLAVVFLAACTGNTSHTADSGLLPFNSSQDSICPDPPQPASCEESIIWESFSGNILAIRF